MKKHISLMMAVIMLISTFTVSFADTKATGAKTTTTASTTPNAINTNVPQSNLAKQIDEIIKENIKSSQFSGTVLLAEKGKIVLNKGYGYANLEYKVPNTGKTVYRLGSLSKQLTAVAILKLEEKQLLSLKEPISMYIPDFPNGDKITLEMLLHHTSGLVDRTDHMGLTNAELTQVGHTPTELVEMIRREKLGAEPGKKYFYSNHGYILLGFVIEKVSGMSYFDFLKKEVLSPLGISGIQYDDYKNIVPNRAEGYQVSNGKKLKADYIDMSNPYSAGGLLGTTEAYLKWQRNYNNTKFLTKASWDKFFKVGVKTNRSEFIDEHYGLGVMLTAYKMTSGKVARMYYHTGGVNGFRAFQVHVDIVDIDLIILSNNESIDLEGLLTQMLFVLTSVL